MQLFLKLLTLFILIIGTLLPFEVIAKTEFIWRGEFNNQNWVSLWEKDGTFIRYSDRFFSIGNDSDSKPYLEVWHQLGSYSKQNKPGGFHFRFNHFSEEKAVLVYEVMFEKGFNFGKGGKLPGLCGGIANTGSNIPNGEDGFSLRYMWREGGKLFLYCHLPTSKNHGTYFDTGFQLLPGRWHILKQVVSLNTPGLLNGKITVYLDDQPGKVIQGIRFRDINKLKIDGIVFSNFFGGSTPDWKSPKDQKILFRSFVAGT